MQLQKHQLKDLLEVATTNQLFQFNGELYEQTDGVAMGSPLGPLLANRFHVRYRRPTRTKEHDSVFFIEDMLMTLKLQCLTQNQRQIFFKYMYWTMCTLACLSLPFLGTVLTRCGGTLTTEVYRKPTDTGLLLHFQSHVDSRYKKRLINRLPSIFHQRRICKRMQQVTHHVFKAALSENIGWFQHK